MAHLVKKNHSTFRRILPVVLICVSMAGILVPAHDSCAGDPVLLVRSGDYEKLSKELGRQPDLVNRQDKDGMTLLHYAALEGDAKIVSLLLDKGADIHLMNVLGRMPLKVAVYAGKMDVVLLLLGSRENVDWPDRDGKSALHIAAAMDRHQIGEYLVTHGADVNRKDSESTGNGATPLHYAAEKGALSIAKILIEKGADCNALANHGFTPLHLASTSGKEEMVSLLISKGADINLLDVNGRTALDIAEANRHEGVVNLINNHNSRISH